MMQKIQQKKRLVVTKGEVQLPIRVGEEACYLNGGRLLWTDRVKRILEIAADSVRIETSSYFYLIEWNQTGEGHLKAAA